MGRETALADAPNSPDPFDVRTIRHLVNLMTRHDLSEIDLRQGEHRIRLRRGPRARRSPPPLPEVAAAHEAPPPLPQPTAQVAAAPASKLIDIKSPTVGTFYAQPSPEAPPYVTVGTRVTPSTVVCQIEAMKIFNEIMAECSGVIKEVLVKNKEPVEYGTVLFRVDPHG
jgi:acetyl-CoA carboxylase biotin carboxyl carrier protein